MINVKEMENQCLAFLNYSVGSWGRGQRLSVERILNQNPIKAGILLSCGCGDSGINPKTWWTETGTSWIWSQPGLVSSRVVWVIQWNTVSKKRMQKSWTPFRSQISHLVWLGRYSRRTFFHFITESWLHTTNLTWTSVCVQTETQLRCLFNGASWAQAQAPRAGQKQACRLPRYTWTVWCMRKRDEPRQFLPCCLWS